MVRERRAQPPHLRVLSPEGAVPRRRRSRVPGGGSGQAHPEDFYAGFLRLLFFEAFAKAEPSPEARATCGRIPYLNGGLFRPHRLEEKYEGRIRIPSAAFDPILRLFGEYAWTFNDVPDDPEKGLSPDVLGYIFEKYINQKEFGAYYTPHEITEYLCIQTVHRLVLDKMREQGYGNHESVGDMLLTIRGDALLFLLRDVLPSVSLLDPACGSGAFLYAALNTLLVVYTAAMGRIADLRHEGLDLWRAREFAGHRSEIYWLKKRIITDNLYGVDLMEEATEIAKLRLFMALVGSARPGESLEPLPNIDFNILAGNSLVGLMRVEDEAFDKLGDTTGSLFGASGDYAEIVHRRNVATRAFRYPEAGADVGELGRRVDDLDAEALPKLDAMLLEAFRTQGVRYDEAVWDAAAGREGKPRKRAVEAADVRALEPFHWGYAFNERFANGRGFDAIITNPPWEILKPQAKEFFAKGSKAVTKNTMSIKAFEAHRTELLAADPELKGEYEAYLSRFPYQSAYFRTAPEYANQSATVNGKRTGTDVNLYKLFTERCLGLLRPGGLMGIVIPSGFYTDLGAKGLRRLFFEETEITGLFGFENRRMIFEGVHRSFKFIVLSARKGGRTEGFPAAFMRTEPSDLRDFPRALGQRVSVELVKRLSPDSWSLMEFRDGTDVGIAERMLRFPLLGERIEGAWNLKLTREFDMTNDSGLFRTSPGAGRLPLFEGKMIHQFSAAHAAGKYWVDEKEARAALLNKGLSSEERKAQRATVKAQEPAERDYDFETYRLAYREIARNTDTRTVIACVLPPRVFANHKLHLAAVSKRKGRELSEGELLYVAALFNSFVYDYQLRHSVTTAVSFFLNYQAHAPRLSAADAGFAPLVARAARLVGTDVAFADLWNAAMADGPTLAATGATVRPGEPPISRTWTPACGATDPALRGRLRAEVDGLVAHLYGMTEAEFAHILGTFPLVKPEVRSAALLAYGDVARGVLP